MRRILAVALGVIIVGGTVDLVLDEPDTWLSFHVIFEVLTIAGAALIAVALLLLKGYSHKHVAHATDRSERTARQHAAAVYRKAGLGNRNEFAAFFLEDLMLPQPDRQRT